MACTNDARVKAAEVADGMRRFGNFKDMQELYARGVFRHIEDVAYARIMLERRDTIANIATYLDALYASNGISTHRCSRVFPPS